MVRKKNRYLVVKIKYADDKIDLNVTENDIKAVVKESVKQLYGDYGLATYLGRLYVKYTNPYTQIFFLQCARDCHREIRACVSFVKMLRQRFCVLTCIHLSATIKSAERFLLDYNAKAMRRLYDNCQNPSEKRKIFTIMEELKISPMVFDDNLKKKSRFCNGSW